MPANAPSAPYAPQTRLYTLIGGVAGLAIAASAVALLGYLDNTVKAHSDVLALSGGPLLSTVPRLSGARRSRNPLFVLDQPNTPAAETIRLLRTNLEFAAAGRRMKTFSITSAGPGEGKSTITSNLAVALAQAGLSTAIVDADLRRPTQHRIFGAQSNRGLSWILTHDDQPWRSAAVEVGIQNLLLIPSGPLPPNPADLLTLDRFQEILAQISKEVDIVVIETPPVLAVSDPLVVASKVDAVALVCLAGRTRIDALRRAAMALQQGGARVVGVVLNGETGRGGTGYYYGKYESTPNAALPSSRPSSAP